MDRRMLYVALECALGGGKAFSIHTLKGIVCCCEMQNGSAKHIAGKNRRTGMYNLLPVSICAHSEISMEFRPSTNPHTSTREKGLFDEVPLELVSENYERYDLDRNFHYHECFKESTTSYDEILNEWKKS